MSEMSDQLGLSGADGGMTMEAKSETWQELATSQEVGALCDDVSFPTFRIHLLRDVTHSFAGPTSNNIRASCLLVPRLLRTELS